MAEIVNLRLARKRKARAEDADLAAQNRAKFGRPKSERTQTAAEKALTENRHEAHKRETPEEG